MKIYTKTGDKGTTSLLGGTRVIKSHIRIEAYGTIDELNSHIGLLRDQDVNKERLGILKEIQDRLFSIGSILASDPKRSKVKIPDLHEADIELLEKAIDNMNRALPEMRSFILPGGHQSVSFCHIARCVCRRAERIIINLSQEDIVADIVIVYLNRLSDYLFVVGRKMALELGSEDVEWKARM